MTRELLAKSRTQPISVPAPRLYKRSSTSGHPTEKEVQQPLARDDARSPSPGGGLLKRRSKDVKSPQASPNLGSSGNQLEAPKNVGGSKPTSSRTNSDEAAMAAMKGFGSRVAATPSPGPVVPPGGQQVPTPKQHDLSATEDPSKQYKLLEKIGSGSFGVVYRAIHITSGTTVAIKQIDLEDSDDDITEIQMEIAHLSACDSDWVTRYYGSFVRGYKLWIGKVEKRISWRQADRTMSFAPKSWSIWPEARV